MEIAIHLGAHCTDGDLLLRSLGENRAALLERGVAVPLPGRARPAIRQALTQARDGRLPEAARHDLVDALLGDTDADRIVLSHEGFLGAYARVLDEGRLYREAGVRARLLRALFADHEVSFLIGLRNPAAFIPALFEASTLDDFAAFAGPFADAPPSWAVPLRDIAEAGAPVTAWCNEDLPLLWPEILREAAGVSERLDGEDAILRDVMSASGFARYETYLRDNPPPTAAHGRRVATAFLAKYARPEALVEEIAQPGWDAEVVARLSAAYEADLPEVARIPGVRLLTP